MANWAVVINNQIEELHDAVPKNWRHISGLYLSASDSTFMNSVGWYPIQHPVVDIDTETQEITGWDYSFNGQTVVARARISVRDTDPIDTAEPIIPVTITPTYQQILSRIEQYLREHEILIDIAILESVDNMITQQDSAWREQLRNRIEQNLIDRQAINIAHNISGNADFHTAVAHAIKDDIVTDMIYNRGNRVAEILIQQGWLSEPVDLQSLKQNIENMLMATTSRTGRELDRILGVHRSHINTLINLEEIGKEEPADELDRLRLRRNKLLQKTDYTQTADMQSRMSQIQRDQWAQYRQDLRDLPQRYIDDGGSIVWPEAP